MPVRGKRPEDDRPLFRALNEQPLIRPVSAGQNGASQATAQQKEPGASAETKQASETSQGDKGPIAKAINRAQENNWIYGSVANKARKTGLVDKADELLSKLTGR